MADIEQLIDEVRSALRLVKALAGTSEHARMILSGEQALDALAQLGGAWPPRSSPEGRCRGPVPEIVEIAGERWGSKHYIARRLGCSARTLDRLARRGEGPPRLMLFGTTRYKEAEFLPWWAAYERRQ